LRLAALFAVKLCFTVGGLERNAAPPLLAAIRAASRTIVSWLSGKAKLFRK